MPKLMYQSQECWTNHVKILDRKILKSDLEDVQKYRIREEE